MTFPDLLVNILEITKIILEQGGEQGSKFLVVGGRAFGGEHYDDIYEYAAASRDDGDSRWIRRAEKLGIPNVHVAAVLLPEDMSACHKCPEAGGGG